MKHKLFVYGTLKKGLSNHNYFLKDSKYITDLITPPKFTMLNFGGYPGVIPGGTTRIAGQLFEVDTVTLKKLDRFEGHPSLFQRTPVQLGLSHNDSINSEEPVWMYLFNNKLNPVERIPTISTGIWKE